MQKHFYIKYGQGMNHGVGAITTMDEKGEIKLNDSLLIAVFAYYNAIGKPNLRLLAGPYVDTRAVPGDGTAEEITTIEKYKSLVELFQAIGLPIPEERTFYMRGRRAGRTAALNSINNTLRSFLLGDES